MDKGSNAPTYAGSAKQLDLGIVTIGSGRTQSVDLIRRPIPAEAPNSYRGTLLLHRRACVFCFPTIRQTS